MQSISQRSFIFRVAFLFTKEENRPEHISLCKLVTRFLLVGLAGLPLLGVAYGLWLLVWPPAVIVTAVVFGQWVTLRFKVRCITWWPTVRGVPLTGEGIFFVILCLLVLVGGFLFGQRLKLEEGPEGLVDKDMPFEPIKWMPTVLGVRVVPWPFVLFALGPGYLTWSIVSLFMGEAPPMTGWFGVGIFILSIFLTVVTVVVIAYRLPRLAEYLTTTDTARALGAFVQAKWNRVCPVLTVTNA